MTEEQAQQMIDLLQVVSDKLDKLDTLKSVIEPLQEITVYQLCLLAVLVGITLIIGFFIGWRAKS